MSFEKKNKAIECGFTLRCPNEPGVFEAPNLVKEC